MSSPCVLNAHANATASSIASFVPDPIEKCAVCAASPSSTTFPEHQRRLRTVTNPSHLELFASSGRPPSSSANNDEQNSTDATSLTPGGNAAEPGRSSPA